MKKRNLLIGTLLATAVFGLAACTESNNNKTSVPTSVPSTNVPTTEVPSTEVPSTEVPSTTPSTEVPSTTPSTEVPSTTPTTTVAPELLGINIAGASTHKTEFSINEEFSYAGLIVSAIYEEEVKEVTDYTVSLKDPEGNPVTGNTLTVAGTYTATITYQNATKDYTITVQKEQYKFTKNYPVSLSGVTENVNSYGTEPTLLFQNDDVTVSVEGAKSKMQLTDSNGNSTAHLHDGVMYDYRVQVNSKDSFVNLTSVRDAKLTLLTSGYKAGDDRKFNLTDGETTYQVAVTENDENSLSVVTFDIKGNTKYQINSSLNGLNIYAFILDYSVDADTVVENQSMEISGYDTEFTTTGDTAFDFAAPAGLVVNTLNNYKVPTVTTEYTVAVADSTGAAVTEITTPGTYTVTIALNGTELSKSYEITVTNPNATITSLEVTKSDDTKLKFYGTDSFEAAGLTVVATDSDSLTKTLSADEYTITLALNDTAVDEFTVSSSTENAYTVVVEYKGAESSYAIEYYAIKESGINTSEVKTNVAKGATLYTNKAYVATVYDDETSIKLDTEVTYTLYSDAECVNPFTDVTTAFANEGKVYAKFEAQGYDAVVVEITVAVVNTEAFSANDLTAGNKIAKETLFYEGTWFTITAGTAGDSTVTACSFPANANDDSALVFNNAIVPTGGSRTYIVSATQDITITIYFTSTDSKFTSAEGYSKGGELTVDGTQVETVSGNKANNIAYAYTMDLAAGESVEFGLTSNRMVLFGVVAVQ